MKVIVGVRLICYVDADKRIHVQELQQFLFLDAKLNVHVQVFSRPYAESNVHVQTYIMNVHVPF